MLNKDTDWEAIVAFCHKVNRDLEGPQTAVQLLVHKIQSPQERESLLALTVRSIRCSDDIFCDLLLAYVNNLAWSHILLSHYCTSCIGCHSSSKPHTSWQFWCTKFAAHPLWFYLHCRIMELVCKRTLHSSAIPLLVQLFTRTDFSRRSFHFWALSVYNSLL